MAAVRVVFQLAFTNYIPDFVHYPVQTTFYQCVELCFYNTSCVSLIYNKNTRDCYSFSNSVSTTKAAMFPQNPDVLMYNTDRKKTCVGHGYIQAAGMCIKYHDTPAKYTAARATCIREGGDDLVRLDNQDKFNFLTLNYGISGTFIQGKNIAGTSMFSNGDPLLSSFFALGEPNGDGECVQVLTHGVYDIDCSLDKNFLCEIELK